MIEAENVSVLYRVNLFHRCVTVWMQSELRVRADLRGGLGTRQRLEGNAADPDGSQRFGFRPDAARVERHLDAADVPEARRGVYVSVVGRIDENPDDHAFAIGVELRRHRFAHANAPEVHGGADIDRPQIRSAQYEFAARVFGRYRRRIFQACEAPTAAGGLARIHGDVRAGQYGPQTERHAAGDARAHDPESRILDHQVFRLGRDLRLDQDIPLSRQLDRLHDADVDVLVLYPRPVCFEAFTRLERDFDPRAEIDQRVHCKPDAYPSRNQRHYPDERRPARLAAVDGGFRKVLVRRELGYVSHGASRSEPLMDVPGPKAAADRSCGKQTSSTPRRPRMRGRPVPA